MAQGARLAARTICAPGRSRCTRREELAFQKRYAFATLIRNGITTALPIASLFYRAWGETSEEFAAAADAAETLGLRVYLGPAYRTGNTYVRDGRRDRLPFRRGARAARPRRGDPLLPRASRGAPAA